jgi:hypothetical protein
VPSRHSPFGRPVLRLATSANGHRFAPTRPLNGVLPSWLATEDIGYVSSLGIALGAGGSPVVALTAWHRPRGALVVASLTRAGRVRERTVTRGVEGLVTVRATPTGRVGVLVYDTGIEGEGGECVGDGDPRRVWAAVREPATTAFGPARRLDSLPFVCAAAGAQLVEGPGGRLAILWGTAEDFPGPGGVTQGPTIRLAQAPPGAPFGAAATVLRDVALRSATFDASGAIAVAVTQPDDPSGGPSSGPLLVRRIGPDGAVTDPVTLDAAGAGVVVSDTDPDGRPVVAWRATAAGGLRIATGGL